jgi:hypothetical protein
MNSLRGGVRLHERYTLPDSCKSCERPGATLPQITSLEPLTTIVASQFLKAPVVLVLYW